MELATLDHKLEELRRASSTVSANLLELDTEPTKELLESIELEGVTAIRWSEARELLAGLFVSSQAIRSLLDDVAARRASWAIVTGQRIARFRAVLFGCSIARSDTARSIGERGLLDGSRVVHRCTVDELLAEMSADFATVRAVVFAVADRWEDLPQRVRGLRERAEELGECDLTARLNDLARLVLVDPLAVDDDILGAIEIDVAAIEALQCDAVGEIERLRALVAGLPAVVAAANEVREKTAIKFIAELVPDAVAVDPSLMAGVDDLERSVVAGEWRRVADELRARHTLATDVTHEAERVIASCEARFVERSELRGRLDALEAKAGARDRIEDPALSALAMRARAALFTAPTDLDEARTFVDRYAGALREVAQ